LHFQEGACQCIRAMHIINSVLVSKTGNMVL
jgi:hypothetical protein